MASNRSLKRSGIPAAGEDMRHDCWRKLCRGFGGLAMANAAPVRVNHITKALSLWRTDQNGLSPVRYDGIQPDREGAFAGRTSHGATQVRRRSSTISISSLALGQCLAIISGAGIIPLGAMDNDW